MTTHRHFDGVLAFYGIGVALIGVIVGYTGASLMARPHAVVVAVGFLLVVLGIMLGWPTRPHVPRSRLSPEHRCTQAACTPDHAHLVTRPDMATPRTTRPWVTYEHLSPAAQQAIQHWTDLHTPDQLSAYARRFEWQEELVPTTLVISKVMMAGDHADDFHGNWYAYHRWYLSTGKVPDHGTSRWPVIEATPGAMAAGMAYLDDGWHRFHSYVRAGDTHIPVLRSRPHPSG